MVVKYTAYRTIYQALCVAMYCSAKALHIYAIQWMEISFKRF